MSYNPATPSTPYSNPYGGAPTGVSTSGSPSGIISQYSSYLKPFYQTGVNAMSQYSNLAGQLAQDPAGFTNQIMSGYTASPYEQYQQQLLGQQANQAAAAGGMLGTPNEQQALMQKAQQMAGASQQQYYQDVMQPFQMGAQGLQDLTHQGYQTAGQYGDLLGNLGQIQASQDSQNQNLLGSLIGGAAGILGGSGGTAISDVLSHLFGSSGGGGSNLFADTLFGRT